MLEQIGKIICEYVSAEPGEIKEDTRLRADLGLNSFDLINIAVELERQYNVTIPDRQISAMKTVGDIVNYLKAE